MEELNGQGSEFGCPFNRWLKTWFVSQQDFREVHLLDHCPIARSVLAKDRKKEGHKDLNNDVIHAAKKNNKNNPQAPHVFQVVI